MTSRTDCSTLRPPLPRGEVGRYLLTCTVDRQCVFNEVGRVGSLRERQFLAFQYKI